MNSPMLTPKGPAVEQLHNRANNGAIARMAADIDFLQDRIKLMNGLSAPNWAVLQTYKGMLTRRKAALARLLNEI